MRLFWSEDKVDKTFINRFREVIVDEDNVHGKELRNGDVFYHCGKVNFEGKEKGSIFNRKGEVKEFKSLCRGGKFVFVSNNYGLDKSSRLIELFKKLWSKEEKNVRKLISEVGKKLDQGRLKGFDEEWDKEIDEDNKRWEEERLFYIDCLFNIWDRQYKGDKRFTWLKEWKDQGNKLFEYKVHNWFVDKRVKVFSQNELMKIFGDLRVYHWKNEYKKYDNENSYWFVGSDWRQRSDGRSVRVNNWIKKNNNIIWKKRRQYQKSIREHEELIDKRYDRLSYYKKYLYIPNDFQKMLNETYLEGVRRRKREVESEIKVMKKRDKELQKLNLNMLVKKYSRFKKNEMTDDEEDQFLNDKNKMFRDGQILWNEMIRFRRLKEVKGVLGKWTKKIDKEGLGMIVGIRVRLRNKGRMTSGQYKWFIYKLGGESNLDNIKLKEYWKTLDDGETSLRFFVDDRTRILKNYGIEWDEVKGLDTQNLKKVGLETKLSDQDYRERIGRGKLEGF